jgi:hypothetical protein
MMDCELPRLGGGVGNANYCLLRNLAQDPGPEIDLVTSSATESLEQLQSGDRIRIFRLPVGKSALRFWTVGEIGRWFLHARRFANRLTDDHRYDLCRSWAGVANAYRDLYETILDCMLDAGITRDSSTVRS